MLPDIVAWFETKGIGTSGTDIFMGRLPEAPAVCTALRESGGAAAQWAMDGVLWEKPTLQVLVRHTDYASGRALIEEAYQALLDLVNVTIAGTRYLQAEPAGPPAFLEYDEHDRPIFDLNVQLWKELG